MATHYQADHEVLDGDDQHLRLEHHDRGVSSWGANSTPGSFSTFLRAVETSIGGRTFR